MGQEIERKFLVDKAKWAGLDKPEGIEIRQGYLSRSPEKTVRIRTKGSNGFITVKGLEVNGIRPEFEYTIPLNEAVEMLDLFCGTVLHKTRFEIPFKGYVWEVDEFHSPNSDLILAEIELTAVDETFLLPDWISEEVTGRPEYYNANMV
jgi:CYTH domain-containing protein